MIRKLLNKFNKDRLLKSGFWYTVGNFFLQGVSFITIPIFTHLYGTEDYGIFSLYTTWLSVFTCLISLGLTSSISRAKFDFEQDFDGYTSSVLSLSLIPLLIFLIIGSIFKTNVASLLEIDSSLILILIFHSFFSYVIDLVTTKYTVEYRYIRYLFVSISTAILSVIISIYLVMNFKHNKYLGRVYGSLWITVAYGVILGVLVFINGKKFINKSYWKYGLAISIPLIPHTLSAIILAQFDRIMIKKYVGNGATGLYSFAYNIGMILNVVWAATNKAWTPWFFEKMKEQKYDEIRQKSKYYIAFFSLIAFILIFISPEIGKIMSSKGYWSALNLVPIIMISYFFVFLYSFPANLEFYAKKTYYISIGTFIAGFLNIGLNVYMIPKFGYAAGAWTTLISYIVLFVYHYVIANKVCAYDVFEIKYFIYSILFVSAISVVFYFVNGNILLRYTFVLIVIAFMILKFKDKFIEIMK